MNVDKAEREPQEVLARTQVRSHLRARMKALRQALPDAEHRSRSARCVERIQAALSRRRNEVWALYAAHRGEVDLSELMAERQAGDLATVLPRSTSGGGLAFAAARSDSLVRGAFGIAEPGAAAEVVASHDIAVVMVPALAVDPAGGRLGWGNGYYDRWLATAPHVLKVGVVFDFQLVCELPVEAHDVPLDFVVTDQRMIDCSKGT